MASTPHIWTVGIQALPTKDPFAPITFELLCRIVRNIGRLHSYVILPRYSINFKEFIMKQRLLLFLVVLLTFVSCINSQGADSCRSSTTCHECIGKAQCAWCSMENFATSRCDSPDNLKSSGCPPNNISNPESKSVNEEDNNVGPKVQVQPQRIRLDLRSGQTTTVQLTVRPAENYPVDLYYLMDMSYSMKNDLEKLTKLASKIAASMRNITANFKLGFGSFVDKTVSPYIRTETAKPCLSTDQDATCVPTYGFRHILSLVGDEKQFEDKIKEQIISGNLDEPEGGFDALMQVAVCETKIGWSANGTSRRLVIFVTDAPFHVAGDGKLGGIVTPNDGKCHLEDFSGNYMLYTKSNELDYPSLAQLHDKLQQSNVLPIFAVVKEVSSLYQGVTTMWSDLGAVTGELAGDSSNVVDLIERKYQEIVSSVSLVYNAPEKVSVTVKANCGANAVSDQTQKCSNVKIKEKVTFDVSVTLEQCPQDQADQQKSFTIRVPGFGAVVMELNYICQCECEKPIMAEANSSKCTEGNGTFACGQCDCNKGRYGEYCQCDTPFDKSNDQSKCKSSANATDELPCSGNGECACGKCVCKAERGKRFYGDLCQCNDFSCPEDKGQLCGGPDRGVCLCRKCQCKPKYHGDNCDKKNCTYFPPETQCKKDADSEICGGPDRGTCEPDVENCHKCVCKSAYDGIYCEKCPNCEDGMCSRNEKCALCSTFEGKSLEECKQIGSCEANVVEVQVVDDIKTKTDEGLYRCEGVVDGCTYYFTTETEENSERFVLFVQKEKVSCPEEAPIMWIVVGVVGGILLLGLIILALIKAFFTMVDRIEYQKFERERMHSRWTKEKNPLYQAAKTTFENPTYAGGRQ